VRGLSARSCARAAAVFPVAVLALSAPSGSGAEPASGYRRQANELRTRTSVLQSRTQRAVLGLYALETQLQQAQRRLAAVQAEAARVRAERALVRRQVALAERALTVSQRQLAERLTLLYEQGETDSLAVLLGSTSLDEAITSIDDLDRAAHQSQSVIDQTTSTRRALGRLAATLDARSSELGSLERQAAQTAAALASARAERTSFIASLRTRALMNRHTISSLEAEAHAAEVRSQTLTVIDTAAGSASSIGSPAAAPSTIPAMATEAAPDPAPTVERGRTITVTSTGYSLAGRTATGVPVGFGVVAVDPSVIPLGTRMTIPGYGEGVAADTGGALRGATIDLWFPSLAQARAWGRRTLTIELH